MITSYKTAILAKEKGFNTPVRLKGNDIDKNGNFIVQDFLYPKNFNEYNNCISVPTQSELQKWLREKHNIHIYIRYCFSENDYVGHVYDSDTNTYEQVRNEFNEKRKSYPTYEECLEKLLVEALNRIK
jgi:acyl-CoA thioesterase FadM